MSVCDTKMSIRQRVEINRKQTVNHFVVFDVVLQFSYRGIIILFIKMYTKQVGISNSENSAQ